MLEVVGIICVVQGFGSLVVKHFGGKDWLLMAWASGHGPWAHIAVGVLGIVLTAVGAASRRRSNRA
ncbi:hypothetical protein [Allokutzneria oryzae]|uniref:Uncharacterized protein n=1 Tax=Allokutzneria oryzae TaxID=1378989 RepID=A0ABV5ZNG7_9PSEU